MPHYNVPIFYKGKLIVTIHDLTHLIFPEFLPNKLAYFYAKFNIPKNKKILMYVGNIKLHKNLERLLEAYSQIKNIEETNLLLVGKSFKKYKILEDKQKELNIKDKVIHIGFVTQKELIDLYNLADLFVFPTLYEGGTNFRSVIMWNKCHSIKCIIDSRSWWQYNKIF